MDVQLYSGESLCIHRASDRSFIRVSGERLDYAISVELNSRSMYTIVIEKDGLLKTYSFPNKEWADEFDFGWWADGTKIFESK